MNKLNNSALKTISGGDSAQGAGVQFQIWTTGPDSTLVFAGWSPLTFDSAKEGVDYIAAHDMTGEWHVRAATSRLF